MNTKISEHEENNYFSQLLPLSVEGRELLKVLDTNIYTPINTSNTLQIRA